MNVPMSSIANKLHATITVTGVKPFRVRVWIGMQLLRLAAFVFPFNVEVEADMCKRKF